MFADLSSFTFSADAGITNSEPGARNAKHCVSGSEFEFRNGFEDTDCLQRGLRLIRLISGTSPVLESEHC